MARMPDPSSPRFRILSRPGTIAFSKRKCSFELEGGTEVFSSGCRIFFVLRVRAAARPPSGGRLLRAVPGTAEGRPFPRLRLAGGAPGSRGEAARRSPFPLSRVRGPERGGSAEGRERAGDRSPGPGAEETERKREPHPPRVFPAKPMDFLPIQTYFPGILRKSSISHIAMPGFW